MCRMDSLMEVQADGNSLPLGIYRDVTYQYLEQGCWDLYHSAILPTVVVSAPSVSSDVDANGDYVFDFACFGQDAQAVKLTFFDASAGEPTYTLVFDPDGGFGTMPQQRMKLNTPKRLRRNRYRWSGDQKFFIGWSLSPGSSRVDVGDGRFFDWREHSASIGEVKEGGTVTLFAVWSDVGMGTELVLEI